MKILLAAVIGLTVGFLLHQKYQQSLQPELSTVIRQPDPVKPRLSEKAPRPLERLRSALAKNDYNSAISIYTDECATAGQSAQHCRLLMLQAVQQLLANQPIKALRLTDLWAQAAPDDVQVILLTARGYARIDQPYEALNLLLKLKSKPLDNSDDQHTLQLIDEITRHHFKKLRKGKEEDRALNFAQFLVDEDNGNLAWRYELGFQYFRLRNFDAALQALNQVRYDPDLGGASQRLIGIIDKSRAAADLKKKQQQARTRTEKNDSGRTRQLGLRVPLKRYGRHFVVNCSIEGRREISLLIDTGASLTAVREDIVRSLGFNLGIVGLVTLNTANGKVNAPLTRVKDFTIAGQTVRDMEIAIMSLNTFSQTDGLLGMNYLRHFDFYIDQDQPALYLNWRKK